MGLFKSNVNKTKCDTACSDIISCYNPAPTQKLEAKKERPAINGSTILVSQSKIAMQEAERNTDKNEKHQKSKKDTEGYVHKLQSLENTYSSIRQSISTLYNRIIDLNFVDQKVKNNLQTAKINFNEAIGKIKKYAPVGYAKKKRTLSLVGIKLPPLIK